MDTKQMSEVEYAISSYFIANFLPIMKSERDALQTAQAEELIGSPNSFVGFTQFLAQSSNPNMYGSDADIGVAKSKAQGPALKKTDEDYVESCISRIAGNEQFQADLARLAAEWRNAVVEQVGRAKYEEACRTIGGDLALAYVDHRIAELMIDRMAQDRMPKSSFEYVLRKGASQSLLGLSQWSLHSPLSAEIEARGEAAYKPSKTEQYVAKGVTFVSDTATLGGFSSWSSLAGLTGFEVGFQIAFNIQDADNNKKRITVEECISQGLFGSDENVFTGIVADSRKVKPWDSPYLHQLNMGLSNKLPLPTEPTYWDKVDFSKGIDSLRDGESPFSLDFLHPKPEAAQRNATVQPDGNIHEQWTSSALQKDAYAGPPTEEESGFLNPDRLQYDASVLQPNPQEKLQETPSNGEPIQDDQPRQEQTTNEDGWGNLLASAGLGGIGDLGKNLGYVMAMLPDMLFGFFTGSNKKFNIGDNLMPLASILLGLFIRNPILKMVFIGLGGANLLNKAGHEALENVPGRTPAQRYKQYADEVLDPRITSPALSGNALIANIDRIPYSITLPQSAVDACRAGALPLNTLANAVLRQHDRQQAMAQNLYDQQQKQDNRNIQIR